MARAVRSRWRRALRWAVRVVVALIVLVALGFGFLHTRWGKELVRRRVEAALADRVEGTVRLGAVDYGWFFDEVSLSGLTVDDAAGRPAIRLERLEVALDRRSLLGRSPRLHALGIHGLAVSVVRNADGTSNLTGLFKPSEAAPLDGLRIDRLEIDGAIRVAGADGATIAIEQLAVRGSVTARPVVGAVELVLAQSGATIAIAQPGQPTRTIDAALGPVRLVRGAEGVDVSLDAVRVGPLSVASIVGHLGLVDEAPAGPHRLEVRGAHVDRLALAALLGREPLPADVDLEVALRGPIEALVLDGTIVAGTMRATLDGAGDARGPQPSGRIAITGTALTTGQFAAQVAVARDRSVDGSLSVSGAPAEVVAALRDAGIAVPPETARQVAKLPPRLALAIAATGRLDGEIAVTAAPTTLAIAGGAVTIDGRAVIADRAVRTASATVALERVDVGALAALADRPPPAVGGTLSGTVGFEQAGVDRRGTYALALALASPRVTVRARGTVDPSTIVSAVTVTRGGARLASIDARVPIAHRGGAIALRRTGRWQLVLDVPRRATAPLVALLPPDRRRALALPPGELGFRVDLAGTPARPTGTLTAGFVDRDRRLDIAGTIASTADAIALTTRTTARLGRDPEPVAIADTTLTIPARAGVIDPITARTATQVDATITLPTRDLASLSALAPALAPQRAQLDALGGAVGGTISIRGVAPALAVDADLRWKDYRTAAGTLGETSLRATGTVGADAPVRLTATLDHNRGFAVTAQIDRATDGRVALAVDARAADTALRSLLPALVAPRLPAGESGTVRSDLAARMTLVPGARGDLVLDGAPRLTGSFALAGATLPVAGSDRVYRDVGLTLTPVGDALDLAASLHERDLQHDDRRVEATGRLTFAARRPARLTLDVRARDWLVSGAVLGPADAPRGTVDLDVGVVAELGGPIPAIDATITHLALMAPARADLMLQPEPIEDDLIELAPGAAPGTLPVARPAARSSSRPMDVRIHIPQPIQLTQGVLTIATHGEIAVEVRADGTRTRGALIMDDGTMNLFGNDLALEDGQLAFTDDAPGGRLSLAFARRLPAATVRALARRHGETRSTVDLDGPVGTMTMSMGGGTNVEFTDVVAVSGLGHHRLRTAPGFAASESVQVPRGMQLFMLAYFASALPQYLFLDRFTAWSDPADGRYGRIEHVEAERLLDGARARATATARPPAPGRSTVEVGYDRLLVHDDAALGVGVRAGTRGGGGVGVIFEWSSAE